eukprot:2002740-Rhodomonas_salina.1
MRADENKGGGWDTHAACSLPPRPPRCSATSRHCPRRRRRHRRHHDHDLDHDHDQQQQQQQQQQQKQQHQKYIRQRRRDKASKVAIIIISLLLLFPSSTPTLAPARLSGWQMQNRLQLPCMIRHAAGRSLKQNKGACK